MRYIPPATPHQSADDRGIDHSFPDMCPGGLAPNARCQKRCSSVRSPSDTTQPKRPFGWLKPDSTPKPGGLGCWRIYINSGELMPQSPLSPERELCLEFGIGRMRARRARNVLEDAGLVYREVTRGNLVYFCDPASPWQRGSNENTNGILEWSPEVGHPI